MPVAKPIIGSKPTLNVNPGDFRIKLYLGSLKGMAQITPNLYIGSAREAVSPRWLKAHGITHIVNMAIEHKNYFPRTFYYFRGNLYDNPAQSLIITLRKGLQFIRRAIAGGGMVLVHCHAGVSRSSSMVIYYLMKTYGWSLWDSLVYMKRFHPRTNPNPGFIKELRRV